MQGNYRGRYPEAERFCVEDLKCGSEQGKKGLVVKPLQLDSRNSLAPVLEGLIVWNRQQQRAGRFQNTSHLSESEFGTVEVLQRLKRDNGIENRVGKGR